MEVAFLQCLLHLRLYSLLTCGLGGAGAPRQL